MSLLICGSCGIASAIAYGASTAVEHSAAHTGAGGAGGADARGLLRLVRDPRWLLGMGGDTLGLILQVVALSTGPVVLVQPLLVLALPVSLPIGRLLGGPPPGPAQYRACGLIILGLAVFFVLLGNPGRADPLALRPAVIAVLVATALGVAALVAVRERANALKAAVYGGVAGAWFGLVAVLMDAAATAWDHHGGISAFGHADGLVPLVALVLLGTASIALLQVSFQIGALAASFPANLAADPVVAVVLGVLLLHENVPLSAFYVLAYLLCLAAVVFGAVRLAADPA